MVFDYIHILGEHVATLEDLYGIILRGSDEEVSDLFAEPSVQDDVCLFLQERGMDITDLDFSSKQAFLDALGRLCPRLVTVEPINPTMDAGDMDGTPSHQEQKTIRIGGEEFFTVGELKDFLYKERDNGEMIDAIVDSLEDIINYVNENDPNGAIARSLNNDGGFSSEMDSRSQYLSLLKAFGIRDANPHIDPDLFIDTVNCKLCISPTLKKGVLLDVSLEFRVKRRCSSSLIVSVMFNDGKCIWNDNIHINEPSADLTKKQWSGIQLSGFPSTAPLADCFDLKVRVETKLFDVTIYRRLSKVLFATASFRPDDTSNTNGCFSLYKNDNWFSCVDLLVASDVKSIGSFNKRGITWFQDSRGPEFRWVDKNGKKLYPFDYSKIQAYEGSEYAVLERDFSETIINSRQEIIGNGHLGFQKLFQDGYLGWDNCLREWDGSYVFSFHARREELLAFNAGCALIRKTSFIGKRKTYYYQKEDKTSNEFVDAHPFVDGKAAVVSEGEIPEHRYVKTIDTEFSDVERLVYLSQYISKVTYIGHGKYSVKRYCSYGDTPSLDTPVFGDMFFVCEWEDISGFEPAKHKRAYEDIHSRVSEGFLAVKFGGGWGFLNVLDDKLIDCRYDDVGDFDNGFAKVKMAGKWGFVDTDGQIVVDCEFDEVQNIYKRVYPAKRDGVWYMFKLMKNKGGWQSKQMAIPFTYEYIGRFCYGIAPVRSTETNWGIITTDGYPLADFDNRKQDGFSKTFYDSTPPEWDPITETLGIY